MYDEIMVKKDVDIAYLPTNEMTADVLSKPVCGALFLSLQRASRVCRTRNSSSHKIKIKVKKKSVHHGGIHPTETGGGALYLE